MTPDYTYRVEITGDGTLSGTAWDRLERAIADADLEEVIRTALRTALDARVPQNVYHLRVVEETP
jgi:hypothetical protein